MVIMNNTIIQQEKHVCSYVWAFFAYLCRLFISLLILKHFEIFLIYLEHTLYLWISHLEKGKGYYAFTQKSGHPVWKERWYTLTSKVSLRADFYMIQRLGLCCQCGGYWHDVRNGGFECH